MTRRECPREQQVLDALGTSRWPDGCDAELRAHATGCRACADLLAIALPLLDDRAVAQRDPGVPSAAIVWWKAQRRAREEAARAASRPIVAVQWLALACTVGLLAGLIRFVLPYAHSLSATAGQGVTALQALSPAAVLPWLGLAALLLLVPLAVYVATESD